MLELEVVLTTILRRAQLKLVDERPERMRSKAVVLVPAHGVRVRLDGLALQG